MTRGTLGVILCPILEDELIYSLSNDAEPRRLFVVENRSSEDFRRKLERNGTEFLPVDEWGFSSGMEALPRDGFNIVVLAKDLGLHAEPETLRDELRETMLFMQSKVDAIALYYGLCGNANRDVESWGSQHLDVPVCIFKDSRGGICDDCICVALGGTERYYEMQKKNVGVMYYTPAMATKWRDFFSTNEIFRGVEGGDYTRMKQIFDMCDYHDVMEIPTGLGDGEESRAALREFADEFGFRIRRLDPEYLTLEPTDLMYASSKAMLDRGRGRSH